MNVNSRLNTQNIKGQRDRMPTRWRPARLKTHKIKGPLIESPPKKKKAPKRSQVFKVLTFIILGCYYQCRYHNYYYIILTSKITTKMNQQLHYLYPIMPIKRHRHWIVYPQPTRTLTQTHAPTYINPNLHPHGKPVS